MPFAPSTMSEVTSSTEAKLVKALKNSWVKKISASRLSSTLREFALAVPAPDDPLNPLRLRKCPGIYLGTYKVLVFS